MHAGFLKRAILRGAGIEESDLYFTYAVRCKPATGKKANITHVRPCRQYLEEEIRRLHPKVIVLAGNAALHAFVNLYHSKSTTDEKKSSGLTGIANWRGKQVWSREFECWLVPTHPIAALIMDRRLSGVEYRIDQSISDFELAVKLAHQPRPTMSYPKAHYITDLGLALRVVRGVMKSSVVAFDIEAEDLDPHTSELLGISLSDRADRGFYIPVDLIQDSEELKDLIDELMVSDEILKVLHNGAYDTKYLRHKSFPKMHNWKDTMIAASLFDENFSKGLKPWAWRALNFGGYDKELDDYRRINKLASYKGIPQDVLGPYAAYDAVATLQLHFMFEKARSERVEALFSKIQMPVRIVMNEAEFTGFKVDIERANYLDKKCDEAVNKLTQKLYAMVGREFNMRSPIQLAQVLYKDMKLKPLKTTMKKTGEYSSSCDKASLQHAAKQKNGEVAQLLLDIKYIQSQQSKFIKLVLKNVQADGRVHTNYNLTGTVTGRTSCSNPSTHNIPRDRFIRSIFVASDGCRLVEADVKSAELRCLAVYCGEQFLLRAFNEGRDLHTETFNIMYNKPADYKPTDDERFIAKSINFGLIYGRGPKSLADVLGITTDEAVKLIELYFKKMPGVRKFLQSNVAVAHKQEYVESLFGRRRHLPLINADDYKIASKAERQANNSVIQSAAADFTYIVLARVAKLMEKAQLKARIVHTVHDCVIVDTPLDEIDIVKEFIERAYSAPVNVLSKVKMEMDIDDVARWGENKPSALEALLVKAGVIKPEKKVEEDTEDVTSYEDDDEDSEEDDEWI